MSEVNNIFAIIEDLKNSAENGKAGLNHKAMHHYQQEMLERFRKLPVPSPKIKTWTNIMRKTIDSPQLTLAPNPKIELLDMKDKGEEQDARMVITEESIASWIKADLQKAGVVFTDLGQAFEKHTRLVLDALESQGLGQTDKVSAFTAGMSRHGFFLYLPKGCKVEQPIEIALNLAKDNMVLPLTAVIILDEDTSARLVLQNNSAAENGSIALMNCAIKIGDRARLELVEIQQFGKKNWFYSDEEITLGSQAELDHLIVDEGCEINKRHLTATMLGEDSRATITGIYKPGENQEFVYDTHQNHLASHSNSDLLFSGVLRENAYSLWQGNVRVEEGTQGVDGYQVNKNLLLSEDTHVESIPGLEIIADDVRCSHAVTLSSVDPVQMFYLKSRGIGEQDAEDLVVSGFLEATAARIKDEKLLKLVQEELE